MQTLNQYKRKVKAKPQNTGEQKQCSVCWRKNLFYTGQPGSPEYAPTGLHTKPRMTLLWTVWFCGFYLSLREEGARELRQISTGLHRLLKLTSDVILAWTRDSLMGSRKQEMYSKYNAIWKGSGESLSKRKNATERKYEKSKKLLFWSISFGWLFPSCIHVLLCLVVNFYFLLTCVPSVLLPYCVPVLLPLPVSHQPC